MGIVIFIGDYSNAMLVGPTMRPLTDHHRVSREKLAFLVDSTSAPIAGLAFVSTWIGYEVGLFEDISGTLGLGRDGYSMFFDALSFRFYCVLTIIFVIVNAISGRDYGAMHQAEVRARETGRDCCPRCAGTRTRRIFYEFTQHCCSTLFGGFTTFNAFWVAIGWFLDWWQRYWVYSVANVLAERAFRGEQCDGACLCGSKCICCLRLSAHVCSQNYDSQRLLRLFGTV